jgi:hypothetical protein
VPFVRRFEEYRAVVALIESGLNDCEIQRALGVPRRTVLDWRHGRRKSIAPPRPCSGDHDYVVYATRSYAYLLGAYLGDGYISRSKGTFVLRITLDTAYPQVIGEVAKAMEAVWPAARTFRVSRPGGGCVDLGMRSRHWPCLFPQHGVGRKHERAIELAVWQQDAVTANPQAFLRGLVHTDGCRFVARDRSGGTFHEYVRYSFSNRSEDIKGLFGETCDALGIHWTRAGSREIAIARRADVRRLDEFIGPKR